MRLDRRQIFCKLIFSFSAALSSAQGGTLFSSTFDAGPLTQTSLFSAAPASASLDIMPRGTIDSYRGSPGQALVVAGTPASGALEATTPVLELGTSAKGHRILGFGFDLRVSELVPVRMALTFLDKEGNATGRGNLTVYPPAAGCFFRFTPDLADFEVLSGKLDPACARVRIGWEIRPVHSDPQPELTIDNLTVYEPTFYVSSTGRDTADGKTAESAWATLQKAVTAASPGDVILVLDGTYTAPDGDVLATIGKRGAPASWFVLRAAPGHRPVLRGKGWNVLFLDHNAAYWEIRGFNIHGFAREIPLGQAVADGAVLRKDGRRYGGDPAMNTNGISVDARKGNESGGKAHHIRIIDNLVRDMPGGGISVIAADYITVQGNTVRDNCHRMRYAGSGISLFRAWDFDDNTGFKMFVLGNEASGNRCHVGWTDSGGRISDGNGIIIDDFLNYQTGASGIPYEGRTLVQNNLSFGNGGSGLHSYAANHVDFIHNTAYHNAQSPELNWRQISGGGRCRDVLLANNIMHAQAGRPVDTQLDFESSDITYRNNVIFSDAGDGCHPHGKARRGKTPQSATVENNIEADPFFVNPSLDPALADFRLRPGSPAINAARVGASTLALVDKAGTVRPQGQAEDCGALETVIGR